MSVAFPKFFKHDLSLVKPGWLSPITSLFSIYLRKISRRICSRLYQASWYFCLTSFLLGCIIRELVEVILEYLPSFLILPPSKAVCHSILPRRSLKRLKSSLLRSKVTFLCTFLAVPRILTPGALGYFSG